MSANRRLISPVLAPLAWLPGFLLCLPFVAYWVVRALLEGEE